MNLSEVHTSGIPKLSSPSSVLIRIYVVSVNFRDLEVVGGKYTNPAQNGPRTTSFRKGDRVSAVFNTDHVAGEITIEMLRSTSLGVPVEDVLQQYRPAETLSDIEAAAPGQSVLVFGTGGVFTFACQITANMGCSVIATSSSDDKIEITKKLGARHGINYIKTPEWDKEVLRLRGGAGVHQVIECGGKDTLVKSFSCVRFGGLISVVEYLDGKGMSEGEFRIALMAIRRHVTFKEVSTFIDKVFPFSEAKQAFEYIRSQKHVGKIVIKVTDD
ncbi:NAD(P)-binding protein [Choiromyces venosus 120613-1]|uniref:NAD(P)-binding protein n=1 Tax=Choiromyces venosus 120613-1 TaxID=1336337 RepID=A0A3N4JFP0_9PEZI|nr:NAD(P)-binding protein [Choiromyces venosus 120613-1]